MNEEYVEVSAINLSQETKEIGWTRLHYCIALPFTPLGQKVK